ncbi:MAG: DUF1080 domain-containing protein [Verrucomicrobiae bacterium]|nr:DUF1080 domain-containing protein [Verrucomicrobiae bacterium]
MKTRWIPCAALVISALAAQAAGEGEWMSLFNGKDLTGWTPKIKGHAPGENFGNTFRVEDGMIRVRYDGYESFGNKFGHLFFHRPFTNYRVRVEYRFVGEQLKGGPGWAVRNSGVMVHGQSAESMGKDQDFPVSVEVQLLGGDGTKRRTTGNFCTPGTHVVIDGKLVTQHVINSKSETFHGDQWVTAEIEVRGNSIRNFINGVEVLSGTDPQLDEKDNDARRLLEAGAAKMVTHGTISLQSESHPVDFRKVEILELAE